MPDVQSLAQIPVLAAILTALMQAVKVELSPKYVPAVTVLIGIVLGVIVQIALGHVHAWADAFQAGLFGLIAGLSATGLYENTIDKAKAAE